MQNLQQALWMLADQLHKALHIDELPGEIALLILGSWIGSWGRTNATL